MRMIRLNTVESEELMFDDYVDTQTEETDAIVQSFSVSGCNAVTVFNTYGVSITLDIVDDGISETIYSETVSLLTGIIDDWWDYWFSPFGIGLNASGKDAVFYFPTQGNSTATITISYPGGTAKCGLCQPGIAVDLGVTLQGVSLGISDYSFIDTNAFGVSYLSVGSWAKRAKADIVFQNSEMDAIRRNLISVRATPAVWDLNNYDEPLEGDVHTSDGKPQSLLVYGFLEDFGAEIKYPRHSKGPIEIQGMI